jgi:histone deacetylase 11
MRVAVCLAACLLTGCVKPPSFEAVRQPRDGKALGGRVAVVYSANYQVDLGGAERMHNFDIRKYARIYVALNTAGLLRPQDVFVPQAATRDEILRVHTPEYLESLNDSARVAQYLEAQPAKLLPAPLMDAGILRPFRYAAGGTILAARLALKCGIAVNLGGGYHHAKPDKGEGFCIYADMPIAIRTLQAEGLVKRTLIVDLDVHQGNGTAVCLGSDPSVFIFDMHQAGIYPQPREKCTLDVDLPAGTDDASYLATLRQHLAEVFDRARPDLVFLQAGVDTLAGDPLASLAMTPQGIVARDAMVIDEAVRRGVPIVMVLGGGYSPLAWQAQFASIRRTILTYGVAGGPAYPPRDPTGKESLYIK